MTLFEFFNFIWDVIWTAASDSFMESPLSLLIYLCLITAVVCYFINLVRMMRKY